ncbi:TetR family transcriptional regulator [Frankia sp. CcI49]|uniref:TetR/AcrR family transcriptional regulator n=1 Tax=unclassified Frankia TaxID=2632575 RepID=UPI0006CA219C|nr:MULTISPECIES: TetR/AcrR family transcriptional regulator [unclassified Frankia]KPM56663.1 TetR family transcriptional regulator [Frankia sp. R43]ONH62512.1 TetR family transcriptional regulator [Frankia sp. CcI49]
MRADAQRNAGKLREAAAELFAERGLQVPLKEIARRAGVSHGTLYNLFGSREALIDEVVVDLAADRLAAAARDALAHEDAWEGFACYIEKLCELQATDPALADVLSGRYPGAERLMDLCSRASADSTRIIQRAQDAGELRPDFTGEDLALTFGAIARLARASAGTNTGADTAPDVWRRSVAFLLDGLRTGAARGPLPTGPATPRQAYAVLSRLSGIE